MPETSRPRNKAGGASRYANGKPDVIFVPGGVTPVALSYAPTLEELKGEIHPILKDLEVYRGDSPPSDYTVDTEVEGIRRSADEAGLESFHLVGFSGGGTACIAFTARYPEPVRSLALIEPAYLGKQGWTADDIVYWKEIDRLMALPDKERMEAFLRLNSGAGQPPAPQPGPRPEWMAKRPAGLEAMTEAFRAYDLDLKELNAFRGPVYLAIGSLSHPSERSKAERLRKAFPDVTVEVYEGLHHINPPHRAAAKHFAKALRHLWKRAEARERAEQPRAA